MKELTEEQREARRKYEREWRKRKYANDPEYRKRKKETDQNWVRSQREAVKAYKLEHGCSQCGYRKCAGALHFHHVNGEKLFNVGGSEAIYKGTKKLWSEIAKCSLLCANCHAENTWA